MSHNIAIAIDIGGTQIKGAAVAEDGQILARAQTATDVAKGPERVLENIFFVIEKVRAAIERNGAIAGIGIGAPAPIRHDGVGVQFPNLNFPDNFPIRDTIAARLSTDQAGARLPVIVHNDANAAMIGEAWMGAARDAQSAVMFTLGTGIGGGIIINGKLFDGGFGLGAELGHMRMSLEGPRCGMGVPGCFEAFASATAVVRMAQERIGNHITDSKEVYDLALSGNAVARAIWEEIGMWIGVAVGSYINIFNPQFFIVGGQMAGAWEFFAPRMHEEARASSFPALFAQCTIAPATLGNDAGVLGMARAVFDSAEHANV